MPFRVLLRMLMHPEIIQKLSETYPVRRAAQLTVFAMHKTKEIGYNTAEKLQKSDQYQQLKYGTKEAAEHAQNMKNVFSHEVRNGFRQISEELKKNRQK